MKTRTIRITLELLIDDADENTPVEQLLEQAREDMLSDGLSEYVNEDNAEEIPSGGIKARTVYGRELINRLEEMCPDEDDEDGPKTPTAKDILQAESECGGMLCQRTFRSKAELEAYYQGQADMDGWEKNECGEDFKWIPDEVWNRCEKEAYRIYKEISQHIARFQGDDGRIDLLEGAELLVPWHDAMTGVKTNIFDRVLSSMFGEGTNTVSDDCCTVLYKGVYVNIWRHYGLASTGCPFGFFSDKDTFIMCYADENDGYDVMKTVPVDEDGTDHTTTNF